MILASLPGSKALTLNQKPIPGIVQSVSVTGRMQAERNAVASGGRDFVLKGWEPAEVAVELALVGDAGREFEAANIPKELAAYISQTEKAPLDALLQELVGLFKKTENGVAVQYELSFPQTRAWGIGRCYLTDMSSSQDSKQIYRVTLKFIEFRPEIDQVKRQQEQKQESQDPNAPAGPAPEGDPPLSQEEQQQLDRLERQRRGL